MRDPVLLRVERARVVAVRFEARREPPVFFAARPDFDFMGILNTSGTSRWCKRAANERQRVLVKQVQRLSATQDLTVCESRKELHGQQEE